MLLSDLLEALAGEGASPQMLVAAARVFEAGQANALENRRKNDAERQRRHRERHAESRDDNVMSCDVTGPPLPLDKSPPHPQKLNPNPPPPSPPKGAHGSKPKADFRAFWAAYPRKRGKGAAEGEYRLALAKIANPDPHGVLMAALASVKLTWSDPQFIPHPATWLHQRRWEDDEPDLLAAEAVPRTPEEQAEEERKWAKYFKLLEERDRANGAIEIAGDREPTALGGYG